MHLICDFEAPDVHYMTDAYGLKAWLKGLAAKVGMSVQGEIIVRAYPFPGSDDATALSAVCFLAESSITIHTYPEKNHVYLDVFSCKKFEVLDVLEYVHETFLTGGAETLTLQRGLDETGSKIVPLSILEFCEVLL